MVASHTTGVWQQMERDAARYNAELHRYLVEHEAAQRHFAIRELERKENESLEAVRALLR